MGKRATALVSMVSLPFAAVTISALPLPVLTAPAYADAVPPCPISATSITANATVSGTSIAQSSLQVSSVATNCAETLAFFLTCSAYTGTNGFGSTPWTAIRQDGTTDSGSANNRIALQIGTGEAITPIATDPGVFYGNTQGQIGFFTVLLRFAGIAGAVVESGVYRADLLVNSILIDDTGEAGAPNATCANRNASSTTEYAFNPFTIPITITVPEACTSTFPTELNFGDITDTSVDHDASATVATTCNSNTLKYNVYVTGGTGSDNAQLAMSNGSGGTLAYGLYTDASREAAFTRTGLGAANVDANGPYIRSTVSGGDVVTLYGRVPAQTRPASGDYSDTVMIHVEY